MGAQTGCVCQCWSTIWVWLWQCFSDMLVDVVYVGVGVPLLMVTFHLFHTPLIVRRLMSLRTHVQLRAVSGAWLLVKDW